MTDKLILPFRGLDLRDLPAVGGKNANLGEQVIEVAHRHDRKVGLCGQAPSDHPEFAGFLASIGIDSISVTPDALPAVVRHLAAGPQPDAPAALDEVC